MALTITPDADLPGFRVTAEVRTKGGTGVEMEALTAVSVAALTLFDMLKAVDRTMVIGGVQVTEKQGGKIGQLGTHRVIDFDEAMAVIASTARPLGVESVAFIDAAARVLATDLTARADAPLRAISAMDGYAVHDADVQTLPVTLPVVANIYAGDVPKEPLAQGKAARILPARCCPMEQTA